MILKCVNIRNILIFDYILIGSLGLMCCNLSGAVSSRGSVAVVSLGNKKKSQRPQTTISNSNSWPVSVTSLYFL